MLQAGLSAPLYAEGALLQTRAARSPANFITFHSSRPRGAWPFGSVSPHGACIALQPHCRTLNWNCFRRPTMTSKPVFSRNLLLLLALSAALTACSGGNPGGPPVVTPDKLAFTSL